MRSRRSALVSVLAASALVTGAIAAPAYAAEPTPDFTAGAVTASDPPQEGARTKSGQLAESDAALLGRSDAAVVPVMVKVDVDPVASYAGGLDGFAATIDPSAMTDDQYTVVRAFLLRERQLAPGARQAVAADLATRLAAVVRHPWFQQVPPEAFLLCAIARYQRQHFPGYQAAAWPGTPPGAPVGGWHPGAPGGRRS